MGCKTRHEGACRLQNRRGTIMLSGDDLTITLFFIGTAISIACAAMSAAGWRHRVLIGSLFSLAGVCFFVGVAWPLLKTVSLPATAIVNQVATNPIAWFVVLILGMTASILLPKRDGRTSPLLENVTRIAVSQDPVSTQPQGLDPNPKKVFVNVSPSYLIGFYKNGTKIQGDDYVAAYIGKWITVTGTVCDIKRTVTGTLYVQIIDNDRIFISATLNEESLETIYHIARDATITVRGEICLVDKSCVILGTCELDETSPS
jgi:tRNA_anti-like